MGFLDRLFGRKEEPVQHNDDGRRAYGERSLTDEQALERYRYMLRTAPPETIERAHEEALAKLTPEQRRMALQELANQVPYEERSQLRDDPRSLARAATRAEMRQPGTIERSFGGVGGGYGMGGGIGMGGMIAGSILSSLAFSFIGTAIAHEFFDNDMNYSDEGGTDQGEAGADQMDAEQPLDPQEDYAGDSGSDFADSGDFGGDTGGDFGGGDF